MLVPCRITRTGAIEVLLVKHSADAYRWANMWHVPITTLRDPNEDRETVFSRIFSRDMRGVVPTTEPVHTETAVYHTAHGKEVASVHYVEVVGMPIATNSGFHPATDLPADLLEHQMPSVVRAAAAYQLTYTL
jgi:hypothetical protein